MSVRVEVQYTQGCPHAREFLERVRQATAAVQARVELVEVLVEDATHAGGLRFRGSPTLLINGKDLEGAPGIDGAGLGCRVYRGGLPSVESIRSAIHAATR